MSFAGLEDLSDYDGVFQFKSAGKLAVRIVPLVRRHWAFQPGACEDCSSTSCSVGGEVHPECTVNYLGRIQLSS